jgi:hydrogenase nickel incorporation protein HypA/HybF
MHELSIAQGLMKILLDEAQKHHVSRITKVSLRVGKLSNLVPDALLFAFSSVTEGTVAEGAHLEMDIVPAKARCAHCNIEFEVEDLVLFCPQCDQIAAEFLSGRELEIVEIEAE